MLLVADADDDLAEGSFFEAVEGLAGVIEGMDRVDDGVELDLVELAQHVFEGAAGADGDAAKDAVLLDEAEERDGGVEAVDDADDGDLALGLDGLDGAGEVGAADDLEDLVDALLVGEGEGLVSQSGVFL